jgi:hypothetical protein
MATWYTLSSRGEISFPADSPQPPKASAPKGPRPGHGPPPLREGREARKPPAGSDSWYTLGPKGALSYGAADSMRRSRSEPAAAPPTAKPGTSAPSRARRAAGRPRKDSVATRFRDALRDPLRNALSAVRREVRNSRGASGEDQKRHVRVLMSKMGLEEQQHAALQRAQAARLSAQRVSALNQYEAYCMAKGTATAVFPITCSRACGFLTWSVFKAGRPVQSHTLPDYLSNLRVAARVTGHWAVSAHEEATITALVGQLQDSSPSQPKRTQSVPIEALVAACDRLRREGTLAALHARAVTATSCGTLARGTEVGGEDGMQWGDLAADERGLAFSAMFSKMGKKSLAARVRVCPHMPRGLDAICPARCLLEFRDAWVRAGGAAGPKDAVWCKLAKDGTPTTTPLGVSAAIGIVKRELGREGVASGLVSAHWARHAGRRLLEHELGLGAEAADIMGDWRPAVKGGNPKSVGQKHYAHATVDEAWAAAARYLPEISASRCCRRRD